MSREYVPFEYQQRILDFILAHERCAVWAGMGLGKTVATLTILEAALLSEPGPVLVLAPLRVATQTWPDETNKWAHTKGLTTRPITGALNDRLEALKVGGDIHTCNYENLPWLVEHWGSRWPYRTVVADESTKLKSFRITKGGMRARALAKVAHTKIKKFIALTGTPSPNGLQDLWGQMWFIDKGERLGRTYSAFIQRWFTNAPSGFGYVALPHAQAEIQDKLRDVCITVEAKDWFDLRVPIVNNVYVDMPSCARQKYAEMEKAMFTELDSGHQIEAFNAAARTMKCLQMANGAAYVEGGTTEWQELHTQKLQALDEIIEEAAGAPVMVAYHFKSDLARLKRAFPQGRELDKNPQTLKAWNAGQIPVLFAHPQSAGHGLNLQDGGNTLVYFAHNWNLEERLQILERIGPTRQLQSGHDRPVFVHNIIARDTVDEMVIERVETKREVQDILMAAMKTRKNA